MPSKIIQPKIQPAKQTKASIDELVALARAAAAEAADFQDRFAAEDTEARKIVDIMERFLRVKGRIVYGGAAINAHMPPARKFYDPNLYLPDYDFMTPDPLQDCADLIVEFQSEGFTEVEAKFGIHEGTYKIFVNFRSAADITYMPPEIYERVSQDAERIDGIQYASPNFLRMNMYLELSRPAGMVSRWEKVYERLLLLNEEHLLRAGRCASDPLDKLAETKTKEKTKGDPILHDRIIGVGIANTCVFLSGAAYLRGDQPRHDEVVLMLSPHVAETTADLTHQLGLKPIAFPALGELLPARTEFRVHNRRNPVAVVFETVACHNYTTLQEPTGYRMGSLDLLIQMYYALYFAEVEGYLPVRLLCIIQELIDLHAERATTAAATKSHDVFPLECVGHQPSMPELKKAHRDRVREKREELAGAVRFESAVRPRKSRKSKQSKQSKQSRKHHTKDSE